MALSLVNEEWVDNTLFVVEEDHRNRDHNLMGTNKLKIFYYPTYNVDQQTANIYEFSDFSAAHSLCLRQYQVCINELRYYPLFPILQLIECKHIVATSNMPLESIYYHYLGLLPNIIENGIPVVLRIKTEKQQGESSSSNNPHEIAVLQKKKEIEKFDKFFEQIGEENYFENIIKYVIKFIFVNTQSLIDFEAMTHPLTILFISHCGINSSLEAVKYGKTLLCAPFIADQFYNSQALASREVAKVVDDRIFENIFQNILDALNLQENMSNLQNQMNNSDINPEQTFLEKIAELNN
uniref:glucuronosyltransferase n=1 Tax=Meloidogyne floridensis TaxID=298350 RepID=A0A915NZS7_9BILA